MRRCRLTCACKRAAPLLMPACRSPPPGPILCATPIRASPTAAHFRTAQTCGPLASAAASRYLANRDRQFASMNSLPPGAGLLLIGHGTRSEAGTRQFLQLADHFARRIAPTPLEPAFLE